MTTLLAVYGTRAAATRAPPPRLPFAPDLRPHRRWQTAAAAIARAAPSETHRHTSSGRVNDERSSATSTCCASTNGFRRVHGRRRRQRRTCICVDRGVRNASLAIYVLRHTSSPALTPAHPPPAPATPPATLSGATRPVRQILPFALHHGSLAARSAVPPPHRTDARPFRSTVSAGSCHHRTGLRTLPDDTAPINRDPVSSPDTFFRLASLVQLLKWILREVLALWEYSRFYRFF